jgi:hypothetical protein
MTDKNKIITNLQKALNSLDVTSDLRLILIQTIEYLQEKPVREDLCDYINELSKQFPEVSFAKLSRIAVRVAKWQKEK